MWKSKKFILVTVLVALVLVGSISGVVFAQTVSADNTTTGKTLLARVATILGIDQQKVEDAFDQAQSQMREEALDSYLKKLVDEGKITQAQADQYKSWWQARPDVPLPGHLGGRGFCGGMEWGRGFWGGQPPIP